MGGRGGNSGLSSGRNRTSHQWGYIGFKEATEKAEQSFSQLKKNENRFSAYGINKRVSEIVKYIDSQIKAIEKELSSPTTENGDEKVLYTERRKLRELRKRVLAFGSRR